MVSGVYFKELLKFYENHLKNDVIPFWTRNCIDWECGGINNIVEDDGTVTSTDKFMWSQGRALWTFSALYNHIERRSEWLDIAENIAIFIMRYGRNDAGEWVFKLHRDGSAAEPPKSVYVDAFIILGLTEYAKTSCSAASVDMAVNMALETYSRISPLLNDHSTLHTEPHRIPKGLQSHGPSMIFALSFHELGLLTGNNGIISRAYELAEIVMTQHLKQDTLDFCEFVKPGGMRDESDAGKTFIPGHIIESMWFMERIYRYHDRKDRIDLAMRTLHKYMDMGWDKEYGGIFLACHSEGGSPVWHMPDSKVWWPAAEALYALLKAYEVTGEDWCIDWYHKVHEYAFSTYPDREHGDWHQNLDRKGNIIPVVVRSLAVKDPFHLPRALIYSIETLIILSQQE